MSFEIWNVARSQAQIQAYMNTPLPLPQANLVAYWRFDEGSGNYAYDSSGQGQTGTLINGPAWVPSTAPFIPGVVTLPTSQIAANSATLNALVNPNGNGTTVWFEWGPTTNYGNTTTTTILAGGTNSVPVAIPLRGLTPGQTFNYAAVATNSSGAAAGNNQVSAAGMGIPRLTISLLGTNAVISWPAEATGFSLQSATALEPNPVTWDEVTSCFRKYIGSENVVTLPVSFTSQFFRLAQASAPLSGFNAVPVDDLGSEIVANQSNGAGGDNDSASPGIGPTGDDGPGGGATSNFHDPEGTGRGPAWNFPDPEDTGAGLTCCTTD